MTVVTALITHRLQYPALRSLSNPCALHLKVLLPASCDTPSSAGRSVQHQSLRATVRQRCRCSLYRPADRMQVAVPPPGARNGMLRVDPPVPAVQLQSLPAFQTLGALQNPGKPDNTFPDIVQEADKAPVLRQVAEDVPPEMFGTDKLRQLAQDMLAIMRAAPGVGLAAPQIDVGLKIIVAEDTSATMTKTPGERLRQLQREPFGPVVICNPRLRSVGQDGFRYWEGCLSVSGYQAMVDRYTTIEVEGFDVEGRPLKFQAKGYQARILQHEYDHVIGTLYIDRAIKGTFMERKTPEEAETDLDIKIGPVTCTHELI